MQHGGEASSSETVASTSSLSNALVPSNLNGHQQIQSARPAVLDVSDPLALQWSLAHLSSLIRKALRSIQGEDDVSSSDSSSDDVENCSNASDYGGDGATSQISASKEQLHSEIQSIASAISANTSHQSRQSASPQPPSQQQQQQHHHHHHHESTKHDEGEGGYVRLLLNHGFDKSAAALERDIELERLRKENETLREMLAVANEVPVPPVGTQVVSPMSTSS